jgi:hypothetical protein
VDRAKALTETSEPTASQRKPKNARTATTTTTNPIK